MTINLQPLSNWIVVKPIEKEEKTKSGIFLPDTAKERPQEGKVLAVGPGRVTDEGKRIEMDLKIGDIVVYSRYGGTELKVEAASGTEEVIMLKESDVLAKKGK
ncbi:co-chaperone GroES [Chloroflexota bacterium]